MSAQPPGELALAAQAVRGLLVHQPPALLGPQLLLELQSVGLLPQSVFVPGSQDGAPVRVSRHNKSLLNCGCFRYISISYYVKVSFFLYLPCISAVSVD